MLQQQPLLVPIDSRPNLYSSRRPNHLYKGVLPVSSSEGAKRVSVGSAWLLF